jgi:signal transduction histidine kinase
MSLEGSLRTSPPAALDTPDQRTIAEIRIVLALSMLLAVVFDPSFTGFPEPLSYAVAAAYAASAFVLYWIGPRRPELVRPRMHYWLDAGWLLAIIGITGNSASPLFLLLLFPILVAAAQSGLLLGMAVSLGVAVAYGLVSILLTDKPLLGAGWVVRAGVLLVLGFMVARWAGAENRLKRKLGTLNRLGRLTDLREETEPFWAATLKELAAYFGASSAFFIGREEDGSHRVYEYEAGKPVWSMTLNDEQAAVLAGVPERWVVVWRSFLRGAGHGAARVVDLDDGKPQVVAARGLQALAQTLESRRWLSFPLNAGARHGGRIFLVGVGRTGLKPDLCFLRQLAGRIGLEWDNLLLARQLTRVAASGERERISRDLHDSTVQPYLGLRYGLEALRRKVPDDAPLAADVDELVRMTDDSILQLRGYIRDLRSAEREGAHPALTAIQAQVQQFEEYSGLRVDVRAREFTLAEPRLFEVRQLIAEGLGNIRRHTRATDAALEIGAEQGVLRIVFVNPVARIAQPFKPRSLTERAAAMGGGVEVVRLATETRVEISIPLWGEGGRR